MKRIKALATGVVWTFPDDLADSLLKRAGEFVEVKDEPKPVAKRAPAKPKSDEK